MTISLFLPIRSGSCPRTVPLAFNAQCHSDNMYRNVSPLAIPHVCVHPSRACFRRHKEQRTSIETIGYHTTEKFTVPITQFTHFTSTTHENKVKNEQFLFLYSTVLLLSSRLSLNIQNFKNLMSGLHTLFSFVSWTRPFYSSWPKSPTGMPLDPTYIQHRYIGFSFCVRLRLR
jgi:hypothetical protein